MISAKRIIFKELDRNLFFSRVLKGSNLRKYCKLHNLNYSTFKGYRQGTFTLPESIFSKLNELSKVNLKNINYELVPSNWWQSAAGKKGIRSLFQKYDKSTLNAWRRIGWEKFTSNNIKKINFPDTVNEKLAELVGVYLGDGTLTKYLIRISGDKRYDLPYFNYLAGLIEDIFGIKAAIRSERYKNQLHLEIRSKAVCDYFVDALGFKIGSKIRNKAAIPQEILQQKELFFACLRGLMDTDGSVSKDGGILSVRFYNHNKTLVNQLKVSSLLDNLFTIKSNPREVGTRSFGKIKEYFSLAGSSNLRHIVRYCEYLKGNLIRKKRVLNYYPLYENIGLPFKTRI